MQRLLKKWDTAKTYVPEAEVIGQGSKVGVIYFGTSRDATLEAVSALSDNGIVVDSLRLRSFPFDASVDKFIAEHDTLFLVEQNRDAQMRTLLVNELLISPRSLLPILNYGGMPITARQIEKEIRQQLDENKVQPLRAAKENG